MVCVNVVMTKAALKVAVCALPTDVAYNRCTFIGVSLGLRVCVCALTFWPFAATVVPSGVRRRVNRAAY